MISHKKCKKVSQSIFGKIYSFLYKRVHRVVSSTLLCPAHYCVQHIIVSNKILCPHLPKDSFVHLSHVNMLRSYPAALAKHLSFLYGASIEGTLLSFLILSLLDKQHGLFLFLIGLYIRKSSPQKLLGQMD